MSMKKKPKELTLNEKVKVIKESESGRSQRALAEMYDVSKSQIQRILKNKSSMTSKPLHHKSEMKSRLRTAK